jgi:hypothetical protein
MQAKTPVNQQPILNVPTPPPVAGMKQEPNPAAKGGGGKPGTPGSLPMSGNTKVNQKGAPTGPTPTSPSPGYSKAANSPFTSEGRMNMKSRESAAFKRALYVTLLREAIKPLTQMRTSMARYLLENREVVDEMEEAVRDTDS